MDLFNNPIGYRTSPGKMLCILLFLSGCCLKTEVIKQLYYRTLATLNPIVIAFDSQGGSETPAITDETGTQAPKPADPERSGYAFAGTAVAGISFGSTGNKTFYAQWLPDVPVTVSLWVNEDGSIPAFNADVSLSKIGADGKPVDFTAEATGSYSGIQWRLYGEPVFGSRSTARSIAIKAADFKNGSYYPELTVTKATVPYSMRIHFTVTD
jgi:hypothetical protein